jgi:hypothetical protein
MRGHGEVNRFRSDGRDEHTEFGRCVVKGICTFGPMLSRGSRLGLRLLGERKERVKGEATNGRSGKSRRGEPETARSLLRICSSTASLFIFFWPVHGVFRSSVSTERKGGRAQREMEQRKISEARPAFLWSSLATAAPDCRVQRIRRERSKESDELAAETQ